MNINLDNMPTKVGMIMINKIVKKFKREKVDINIQTVSEVLEENTTEQQRKRHNIYTTNQVIFGIRILDIVDGIED